MTYYCLTHSHTHMHTHTRTHTRTHTHTHTHTHTQSGGLSAYHLEDIDSDDDETLLKDEPPHPVAMATKPQDKPVKTEPSKPSKEELLLMMERVDRDISALETQIATLQKKQVRRFGSRQQNAILRVRVL